MGVALPIVAIAATVIGTAVSAYGSYEAGQATKAEAGYQAGVANNNATIASQNATYATEAGNSKAQLEEIKTNQLIGSQEAASGSSGLDVNTGSPVALRSSAAALGTLSELNIRNNAARENLGFLQQASNYQADATLAQYKGTAASTAGDLAAAGTIIGGAGKLSGQLSSFSNNGAFSGGVPMNNPPDIMR